MYSGLSSQLQAGKLSSNYTNFLVWWQYVYSSKCPLHQYVDFMFLDKCNKELCTSYDWKLIMTTNTPPNKGVAYEYDTEGSLYIMITPYHNQYACTTYVCGSENVRIPIYSHYNRFWLPDRLLLSTQSIYFHGKINLHVDKICLYVHVHGKGRVWTLNLEHDSQTHKPHCQIVFKLYPLSMINVKEC